MNNLEKVFQSLNPQDQELLGVDTLFYLAEKVKSYVELGPEKYAQEDAFGYPDQTYSKLQLIHLNKVSQQLLDGRGLSRMAPIEIYKSGVASRFLKAFHFKVYSKEYSSNDDEDLSFLVSSRHIVDKRNLSLYFRIDRQA